MKEIAKNTLITTALTLGLLTVIATFMGGSAIYLWTVYQHFGVNLMIHLGYWGFGILARGPVMSIALEFGWSAMIVFFGGYLFDWYSSTPLWSVAIILIVVYVLIKWLDSVRVKRYADDINRMIRNHRAGIQEEL